MSIKAETLTKQLESLIAEASRSNTEVISEITKFLAGLDKTRLEPKYIINMQQKLFSEAIQSILALNFNYMKELMHIGVEISKKLNDPSNEISKTKTTDKSFGDNSISAFELKTTVRPGNEGKIAFLLNSDKEVPIICKVQNELFQMETDKTEWVDFEMSYHPQLFELRKGISQRVDAIILIPKNTKTGIYKSKITVAGFEHTHFNVTVEVLEPISEEMEQRKSVQPEKSSTPAKNITKSKSKNKVIAPKSPVRNVRNKKS